MTTSTLTTEPTTDKRLASLYAETLLYRCLIQANDPLKASEIAKMIGRSDFDMRLTRVILATSPHFTPLDRKWTLWNRYLDVTHTFDHNLKRTLNTYGQPISISDLASELSAVYHRPAETFEETLPRYTAEGGAYFAPAAGHIAPREWLLNLEPPYSYSGEDEVLYENFIEDDEVCPYYETAEATGLSADNPDSIVAFLNVAGKPFGAKALQFLAWRRNPASFSPEAFYAALCDKSGATPLLGGLWASPEFVEKLTAYFPELSEQEINDAEAEAQEAAQPLVIGEAEREQLIARIQESEETLYASKLLEDVFEVTPDYSTYNGDLQTLINVLSEDERVAWLGAERFRPQGTLPAYIFSVPALLEIPETRYLDIEGNEVDILLEPEGYDAGLDKDTLLPLAQDVLDEEEVGEPDSNPPANARTVIKYHHKQIGTLPLCQFPSGFFPAAPAILEVEFALQGGQKFPVWINNETRLIYGLYDWFQVIPIDSGAVFTIERQAPDKYAVSYNDESEPNMFISRNRVNELLALGQRAEDEQLPTFDIVREIMEHSRKGLEFVTLLTEVNIVRRASRRLLASILSSYHCFFQRGGAWVYDSKKLSQGFNKSKRKYLAR